MIRHTITVQVPENRRVEIQLPAGAPVGPTTLDIDIAPASAPTEFKVPEIDAGSLPKYFDSRSGKWRLVGRSGVVRQVGTDK
jgi:hypothetical protein